MTQHWRGDPDRQSAVSKFLRGRWPADSLFVLDLDSSILSRDYRRGLLLEWKRRSSGNRQWSFTRRAAKRLGYYGGCFVYDEIPDPRGACPSCGRQSPGTVDDESLEATIYAPDGSVVKRLTRVDVEAFDAWALKEFGWR